MQPLHAGPYSSQATEIFTLKFVNAGVHRHDTSGHLATFDVRVNGQAVKALFDTGATCSCVTGFKETDTYIDTSCSETVSGMEVRYQKVLPTAQ
jgi:predicted aspartyl protease